MKHRAPFSSLTSALPALLAAGAVFAMGCETTIGGDSGGDGDGTSGSAGSSGSAGASSGASGASGASGSTGTGGSSTGGVGGAGGTGGTTTAMCSGRHVTTAKRLVRLTDNQLVNTYTSLFGATAATTMFMGEDIPPAENRNFPPLANIGNDINQAAFDLRDRAGQRAMTYVGSNTATLTTCGANPTDAMCGLNAVLAFAQKAYRRPLTPEETTSIQTLWTELTTTNGGSVAEAIRFGYDAVLLAPEFVYRTEYGGDWTTEGALDQYELASAVSYFLTDGPPDADLLSAAAGNQLTDKAVIRTQAGRILGTPAAHANLEAAMIAYFQLTSVPTIVLDPDSVPNLTVTGGLLNSMYREGQEFMKNTLWAGPLGELITSRRTWVNSQIAMPIYGVTSPSNDVNVFSPVMLDERRSGLLTLSPFLTSKSRPTGTSVVGRGLAVNAALVCSVNPPFPEDNPDVAAAIASQEGWTEKRKADFRADPMNASLGCPGCHSQFDAMGLVLENFDAVGRYRTMDPQGNPIDAAWTTSTLPEAFDYDQNGDMVPDPVVVSTPAQLAQELLRERAPWGNTNALARCMAMNFINYSLADESQGSARSSVGHPTESCAVRAVTDAFVGTDKSFSALITEVAASDTLSIRSPGM